MGCDGDDMLEGQLGESIFHLPVLDSAASGRMILMV